MKKILRNTLMAGWMLAMAASCELDNFEGPDASISGAFYDIETGKLVEQDIINGTKIKYEEQGWNNPEQQTMVVKCDGTYQNTKIFSGKYDFYFEESNFIPPVRLINHEIKAGDNRLDFTVQPYIRIPGSVIKREGNKIVARFIVAPTVNMPVESIGLFAHTDYAVGAELAHVKTQVSINAVVSEPTTYTLEINLNDKSDILKSGKTYYFRVGAKIKATGAKYNYAKALQITI